MEKRGFAFSLDSFVAFSLILIAVQSLVVVSSSPVGYYRALEQANYIAQDSLNSLYEVRYDGGKDLFGEAVQGALEGNIDPSHSAKLIQITNDLVPDPYSYSYDYYDFGTRQWHPIHNASSDCPSRYDNGMRFCNMPFHRVAASSTLLIAVYKDPVIGGDSMNCNVVCKGYMPYESRTAGTPVYTTPPSECTKVPCDIQTASSFIHGDFSVGLLRLTVWG
ncbi:MAG: hypothetical protein ABIH83_01190 [Candidatus Micrarchaeota archaeon]